MAKPNILIRSKKTKAIDLLNHNQLSEADRVFAGICLNAPSDTESWAMRGLIHRKMGDYKEAEKFCLRALKLKSDYGLGHHLLGSVLQCQGRLEEALIFYRKAITLQPNYAETHYFLANALRETGAVSEAVTSYRRALQLEPDFVEALSNLGATLTSRGETQEAVRILNQANALRPNTSEIIFNMGRILQREGKLEEALEKYQFALHLAPDSLSILGKVADTLEKANRIEEAQALIDREFFRAPDNPLLIISAAKLARRAKKKEEAINLLESVVNLKLDLEIAGDLHLELGQLYDQMNDTGRAYKHFIEGNRLLAQSVDGICGHQDFFNTIEKSHQYLTSGLANVPPSNVHRDGYTDPVFIFGFARSGTTLFGQILDSHPGLQTLDEKSMTSVMGHAFEHIAQGQVSALEALTEDQVTQLRKIYFEEAARHVKLLPGNLLIDKMPLNTINVPLIWRVFPHAKIILAIRHPCDVCLSCFMQNFATGGVLDSFFSLEKGAAIYSKVMQIWLEAVRILPLNYHQVRYEDLVTNFESESRALFNFLGVNWNESVRNYDKHAMNNSKINTPSYHQVTEPIYQQAKFRWERYAKEFEFIMPTLQPYIDYFGYKK